jgi:hypothetical protein
MSLAALPGRPAIIVRAALPVRPAVELWLKHGPAPRR